MNLIIDQGNSSAKIAIFKEENLIESCIVIEDETPFEEMINKFKPSKAIFSSVGYDKLYRKLSETLDIETIKFSHQLPVPLSVNYKTPETLGLDRLAGAVGGWKLSNSFTVLVIDAGTAITYDLVTLDGVYEGGSISPGLNMRFKALNSFTKKLPLADVSDSYKFPGKTTLESIRSGVINGLIYEIDGFIDSFKQKYGDIKVYFTGGDALFFDKKIKNSIFVNPNIVLIGLNTILNYNAQ